MHVPPTCNVRKPCECVVRHVVFTRSVRANSWLQLPRMNAWLEFEYSLINPLRPSPPSLLRECSIWITAGGLFLGRPRTIDEQAIIAAARDVFLERGFSATTAEVARRAGVSEGSIFNRFGSKRALFQHAMQMSIGQELWLTGLADRVGTGDVRAHLAAVLVLGIDFFRRMMPLIMMGWSNPGATGHKDKAAAGASHGPQVVIAPLAAYLQAEMERGRLKASDPHILAQMLLSGMSHYAFLAVLQEKQGHAPSQSVEHYAEGLVDVLWNGVSPDDQEDG